MKFRVLRGRHTHKGQTFKRGQIVETNIDLRKLNSNLPNGRKFELVPDDTPEEFEQSDGVESEAVDSTTATLEAMTVGELRQYAEEEEIDLSGLKRPNKQELVEHIKAALV